MDTKKIVKALSTVLWIAGTILLFLIIAGLFVKYPDWLGQLLSNILMVLLGAVLLYKAYQIRSSDRKFASIYLIIGVAFIIIPLLNFTFIKIIAVGAIAFFLITNPRIKKIINNQGEGPNS